MVLDHYCCILPSQLIKLFTGSSLPPFDDSNPVLAAFAFLIELQSRKERNKFHGLFSKSYSITSGMNFVVYLRAGNTTRWTTSIIHASGLVNTENIVVVGQIRDQAKAEAKYGSLSRGLVGYHRAQGY